MKKDHPRVLVRIRPSETESELRHHLNTITIPSTTYDRKERTYEYHKVFEPNANNRAVWTEAVEGEIQVLKEGRSITLLAYGVTGSGKTHTIFGKEAEQGIAMILFRRILSEYRQWQIGFSFVEIYNQNIRDLLTQDCQSKLTLLQENNKTLITNLTELTIDSYQQLQFLIKAGIARRAQSPTVMNEYSSRSHAIIQLSMENPINKIKSKITIIDLAGSEKISYAESSKQITEGSSINKSLLALGNCLNSLSDINRRNGYIPYRDSKLTRLLKESLSGNATLIMIACVNGNISQFQETVNTLNYAARASKIKWIQKKKQVVNRCMCGYKQKWQQSEKCINYLKQKRQQMLKQLNEIDLKQLESKCKQIWSPFQLKQNRNANISQDRLFQKTKRSILEIISSYKQIQHNLTKLDQNYISGIINAKQTLVQSNYDSKSTSIFSKRTASESYHQEESVELLTQRMKRDFEEGKRILLARTKVASPRTFR